MLNPRQAKEFLFLGEKIDAARALQMGMINRVFPRAALVEGRTDVGVLPTGQVAGVIQELPTVAELIARIMGEADAALARLAPPTAAVAPVVPRNQEAAHA